MSSQVPAKRYLKNAWAEKDADGDYWFHIQSGDGHAMFCLSECLDLDADENAEIRRMLDAWFTDQNSNDQRRDVSEVLIYCEACERAQPLLMDDEGDLICSVCKLIIATLTFPTEGKYEIVKVE